MGRRDSLRPGRHNPRCISIDAPDTAGVESNRASFAAAFANFRSRLSIAQSSQSQLASQDEPPKPLEAKAARKPRRAKKSKDPPGFLFDDLGLGCLKEEDEEALPSPPKVHLHSPPKAERRPKREAAVRKAPMTAVVEDAEPDESAHKENVEPANVSEPMTNQTRSFLRQMAILDELKYELHVTKEKPEDYSSSRSRLQPTTSPILEASDSDAPSPPSDHNRTPSSPEDTAALVTSTPMVPPKAKSAAAKTAILVDYPLTDFPSDVSGISGEGEIFSESLKADPDLLCPWDNVTRQRGSSRSRNASPKNGFEKLHIDFSPEQPSTAKSSTDTPPPSVFDLTKATPAELSKVARRMSKAFVQRRHCRRLVEDHRTALSPGSPELLMPPPSALREAAAFSATPSRLAAAAVSPPSHPLSSPASEARGETSTLASLDLTAAEMEADGLAELLSGVSLAPASDTRLLSRLDHGDDKPYYLDGLDDMDPDVSPLAQVLHICEQSRLFEWVDLFPAGVLEKAKKIGEGSYGEVFKLQNPRLSEPSVIKVIPVDGRVTVNGEPQKSLMEIVPEILIAKELSGLRDGVSAPGSQDDSTALYATSNFVAVHSVALVGGQLPPCLLAAWDAWNGPSERSENERPDFFTEEQLFLVFEFQDGGVDLERYIFASFEECESLILQTAFALCVAEITLQFEHRDLHIGNILVAPSAEAWVEFIIDGQPVRFRSHGVKVHIIDFTNSRLMRNGCTIFVNLGEDEALFNGTGSEYQFEIYRLMREENMNEWKTYHPRSNVLWLHYLVEKFLTRKCFAPKSAKAKSDAVILRGASKKALLALKEDLIQCRSCVDVATLSGTGGVKAFSEIVDALYIEGSAS